MPAETDPNFPLALPKGACMDHYEVIRVLGIGNFGVTYEAYSHRFNSSCVIKELLPGDYATRESATQSIVPISSNLKEVFNHCRKDFQREATILHSINHPNVMKILDIFERNGTSYYVMPYARGITFEDHLLKMRQQGRAAEGELLRILHAVIDGLECVHQHGYLHRDIKPENILITETGKPVLIDFGAARQLIGSRSRPMSAILTRGYAPFEQYSVTQNQGPYTDIYALGAVFHRALTGCLPPESPDRIDGDSYQFLTSRQDVASYSREFRHAIDWALRPPVKQRPQTISEWRKALPRPSMVNGPPPPLPEPLPPQQQPPHPQVPSEVYSPGVGNVSQWNQQPVPPAPTWGEEAASLWRRTPRIARLGLLMLVPFLLISLFLFILLTLIGG